MTPDREGPRARLSSAAARLLRSYLVALVCAVVLALFVRTWLFQAYVVPSDSMAPTLLPGDHLLVNKFGLRAAAVSRLVPAWPVDRSEVLVLRDPRDPSRLLIKRCLGLPGDRLALADRQLSIGEQPLHEPYLAATDSTPYPYSEYLEEELRGRDNFPPRKLGPDEFFVLGDHRDISLDSRQFGAVPAAAMIGRAWLVYRSSAQAVDNAVPTTPRSFRLPRRVDLIAP